MPPLSFVCSIQRNILEFCLSLPSHIQFVRKRPWLCLQNIPRLQPLLTIFTTTVLVWVTVTSPLDYCTVLPFSLLPPWLSNNEFSTGSQSKSFTNKSQIKSLLCSHSVAPYFIQRERQNCYNGLEGPLFSKLPPSSRWPHLLPPSHTEPSRHTWLLAPPLLQYCTQVFRLRAPALASPSA